MPTTPVAERVPEEPTWSPGSPEHLSFSPPARLLVIDASGRASARVDREWIALPFEEPVTQVFAYGERTDRLYCARTRGGGLECLDAISGSFSRALAVGEYARLRSMRLNPRGLVRALRPGRIPCVELEDGSSECLELGFEEGGRVAAWRTRESLPDARASGGTSSLSIKTPAPTPPTRCALEDGDVHCAGAGAYGELGEGPLSMEQRASVVPGLGVVVALTAGDRFFCALNTSGDVSCWGSVPSDFVALAGLSPQDLELYPSCPVDLEESETQRLERGRRSAERAKQCRERTCAPGTLDCHLGCVAEPGHYELVFTVDEPCATLYHGDYAGRQRWPTQNEIESNRAKIRVASRPMKLTKLGKVRALAAHERTLCVAGIEGEVWCED